MINPVRTTASWIGGRLFLLLLIVAALVVLDAYRDESSLLTAQLRTLVPDADLVARLERGRDTLIESARIQSQNANDRLEAAQSQSAVDIDERIGVVNLELTELESRRRSNTQKTLALLTGKGFEQDLALEVDIELLAAERSALQRLKRQLGARRTSVRNAASEFEQARLRTLSTYEAYAAARMNLQRYEADNLVLVWVPRSAAWQRATVMRQELDHLAAAYRQAGRDFYAARNRLREARVVSHLDVERVESAGAAILGPLDELIATKRAALDAAKTQADRIRHSVRNVFLDAVWILMLVTLAPVAIKAFWYWIVAPIAETRPPIRLRPRTADAPIAVAATHDLSAENRKISQVSHAITIDEHEELLVQPDFLQSSADRGRKDTKWLLDWSYPFTSIAAGMVALTRLRATAAESFVVSSKTDAFAEVGVIVLAGGSAMVLQPRSLVGVVQPIDRPMRIRRRWLFNLSALITFQFRYLIFEGPATLIVQGCRGVRVESGGLGRSIDQAATIGFSADLDYSPRRSETFGAYLMGMRGLFNDSFSGGCGYCIYEEMPYFGRKSGITGRGLEGLTDGLLKVFGV